MTERIVRASTMRIEKGQVAYDTAMHGESPRRTAATQYTREQHTGAGLLCCLAACSLVKPVFAHVRRGLCPCSISILCHAHSNRVSTGCDHHRLSRAYWHCLHPGDSTVQVWDAKSGHLLLTYRDHTAGVRALAWSPDGTRIVSGGNDNTIQIWNATAGQRLVTYTGHLGSVWAVAWSPDGKSIASGGNDSTVQVWDAKSARRLLTYPGHTAPVRAVAWSPDGAHIASASQDETVQVWNAASGRHLLTYRGQATAVWAVAWSPSGVCVVTATGNTSDEHAMETVQVWNAMTGHLLISDPVPSSAGYADGTLSVAWSPDGTRLAWGGADTIVHLRNAPSFCRR